jgi:putative membrane protein
MEGMMTRHIVRGAAALALAFGILAVVKSSALAGDKLPLDKDFLIQAVNSGNAEIKYSELASSHSSNDNVKAYAKKVAKDHKDMAAGLDRYASDQKVAILAGADKATKDEVEHLSKLQGPAFDQAYIKRMIDDHEKAIGMFEAQAKQGLDGKLKAFAQDGLPILREHLQGAKALALELKK